LVARTVAECRASNNNISSPNSPAGADAGLFALVVCACRSDNGGFTLMEKVTLVPVFVLVRNYSACGNITGHQLGGELVSGHRREACKQVRLAEELAAQH